MKLCNIGHKFDYELEKLIRIFMPFEKIEICHNDEPDEKKAVCSLERNDDGIRLMAALYIAGEKITYSDSVEYTEADLDKVCERQLAVCLYNCFCDITGYKPQWGILTGVRPAKLFSRLSSQMGEDAAKEYFSDKLKVSDNKISLCSKAVSGENAITSLSSPNSFSLYLSVPFCPTRCSYCSFVSHSVDSAKKLIPEYVELLCKELKETSRTAKELGLKLETVYMGGGTPTTLSPQQLEKVFLTINSSFDMSAVREFTVEAGRPDTINPERLFAIKNAGVTRISINPQTLNDEVLNEIGRKHTAGQTVDAFNLARKIGFNNINMDLIAGLPLDTPESFLNTLNKVIELDPESVTVHSLSVKRASSISANSAFPDAKVGADASKMVDIARDRLTNAGILPYYMYRQSKTVGNLENVGYAKKGFEGLYNVYIMDETHTILACGASAVTKLRQPNGNYISRIFNFKYPYEYISRFNEQLLRKEEIKKFYEQYLFNIHIN